MPRRRAGRSAVLTLVVVIACMVAGATAVQSETGAASGSSARTRKANGSRPATADPRGAVRGSGPAGPPACAPAVASWSVA